MGSRTTARGFNREGLVPARRTADVDYRLARQRMIDGFEKGAIGRDLVCDAQPMLLRNAEHCSTPTSIDCPICAETQVRHVTYVFGPRLPAHGRCISTPKELKRLANRQGEFTAYLIEVCLGCRWNHMVRTSTLGNY